MSARTRRLLFPRRLPAAVNHPIRLAEDLTRRDNISTGRVEVGIGMGYALHEFRGFGLPVSRRVSLTDGGLTVLWHAFTGEAFSFEGKRYTVQNVKITPGYGQRAGLLMQDIKVWIEARGYAVYRAALPTGSGDRDAFEIGSDNSPLAAGDLTKLAEAVNAIDINHASLSDRASWIALMHGIKGASNGNQDFYTRTVEPWLMRHPDTAHGQEWCQEGKACGTSDGGNVPVPLPLLHAVITDLEYASALTGPVSVGTPH